MSAVLTNGSRTQLANEKALEQSRIKMLAQKRASADPLPGPLAEAFIPGGIKVGEFTIRKIVASDWIILKQIGSPLHKQMLEWRQNPKNPTNVEMDEQQEKELCYQFTRPVVEVREMLAAGSEAFQSAVTSEIGDKVDVHNIKIMALAVMEQVARSWSTAVEYASNLKEEGEIRFFQEAEESKATASAGGSTT